MKSSSKADKTSNPRELFNSSGYCVKLRLKDAGNTCTVVCSTKSKQQYTISQNKTNQKQTHMRFKLNTPNTIIYSTVHCSKDFRWLVKTPQSCLAILFYSTVLPKIDFKCLIT